ncbi:MAG: pyridoxal 5'-phosphate synthase glutaminase subunit PdxT [Chloroflexi bacterium]|nr:pyridoxal 5'-phosphate synthase glutaminase subunit PdxT [Chloroflexota bacterium]MQC25619.1 pyridoxal 5'-phosphate synthase glutaminase subunit PdxT [Chloroflexota bacterium]
MPRPDGGQQLRIGVLALQGDFAEHLAMLRANGVDAVEVRTMAQIDDVEGMVIPGGESTTIARLLIAFDMLEPLRARIRAGLPVWGTCAGAILLADNVPALDREPLGVMDMTVERNAFGRQIQSFEADIEVAGMDGPPLRAIFIRAPVISRVGPGVEVLATLPDGRIVAAREGRCLATSFHPELTTDTRMHGLFVEMCMETVLARQAS